MSDTTTLIAARGRHDLSRARHMYPETADSGVPWVLGRADEMIEADAAARIDACLRELHVGLATFGIQQPRCCNSTVTADLPAFAVAEDELP